MSRTFSLSSVAVVVVAIATTVLSVEGFVVPTAMSRNKLIARGSPALFVATEETVETTDVTSASNDEADPVTGVSASAVADKTEEESVDVKEIDDIGVSMDNIAEAVEAEAEQLAQSLVDETCEADEEGQPVDDICVDEEQRKGFREKLKSVVRKTLNLVRTSDTNVDDETDTDVEEDIAFGEVLERGWEKRANSSSLRRNAEVWKFALQAVFKTLKPRKLKKKGASEEEVQAAQIEAAEYIRDGLLVLGPSFVKLGQVVATRTDVLPSTFTDVLKTLQDEVPGFSGKKAKEIVSKELGRPFDEVFTDFSPEPLKAASLGQVHTAYYKGKKVAIKVQRAGLKELFDVDLKNLRKLFVLLDKFDPKSDGADRDWVSIYEESERLLYLEIDYLHEARNTERFSKDFQGTDWVRVPEVYSDLSTPRVLVMEFVESLKLTDIEQIDRLGLDKQQLSQRVADAFLRQIVETAYFHCDPHPGNLCVDKQGNLVYYDFGMMDELKPNVRSGFRKFCTALFAGGPTIGDTELAKNARMLVDGVEEAGVLARGADRLAVEKLARYFMRSFKDAQLGKKSQGGVKSTVGTDLQTLTESNVFRFPSTFTFIFRAFASVDGIGKGLDTEFDIGKLAQPFIEKFTDAQKGYSSEAEKNLSIFSKATGLNAADINTAVSSPRKIAYMEETLRSMESGNLKIRVRSLENEKALERMELSQSRMENVLLASLMLNLAGVMARPLFMWASVGGSLYFGLQAFVVNSKVKKFDKTQAKFVQTTFEDGE